MTEQEFKNLLLPADWTREQLEAEARTIYFGDLVKNAPVTPEFPWLENRPLVIGNSEGNFRHVFEASEGWASYHHRKTGELDVERLRRVRWIRPVLEMRVPKTRVYINYHSMKAREYGPRAKREKKRIFVTAGAGLLYFISLKYLEDDGLVLTTAFPPDGQWLRDMQQKSTLLGP